MTAPRPYAIGMLIPLIFMTVAGAMPAMAAASCSSGYTSISSNFNGTSIQGGNWIWFNAHIDLKSPSSDGLTLYFTQQTESSSRFTLNIPDGEIVFSSSVSTATTTYFSSGGPSGGPYWLTTVPVGTTGDIFISGLAYQVPSGGFPGGINPTVWSGCFSESGGSTCAYSLQWQWSAAVYTTVPTNPDGTPDYNSFGVAPTDSAGVHAGTPTAIEQYVIGGARGGGGANYTGSWSGTAAVSTACYTGGPPPPQCTSSTMTTLSVNSVATNGTVIAGFEMDISDCQGNPYAGAFTPATVNLYAGVRYTLVADLYSGPCSFAYWQDSGSSLTTRNVTISSSTTLTAVYYCGESVSAKPSVFVQTVNQAGSPIYGYYIQFFDGTGTNELNDAYSPGFFGQQPQTTGPFALTLGATYQIEANGWGSCKFTSWQDGSTGNFAYTAAAGLTTLTATYACT